MDFLEAGKNVSRRTVLKTGTMALAALASPMVKMTESKPQAKQKRIPVVHTTDLYHPPQDPDDQIDLATVLALDEFDLQGVVLDTSQRFLEAAPGGWDIPRDPGFIPVTQIGYLMGRAIPTAISPIQPLTDPKDTAEDRPNYEQAGIRMLLDILERSAEPVIITVVGSARTVTAAYNRAPELMRKKTRAVVINAGSTGGAKTEWNVGLDLHAFVGLWQSGLPIHWYPCGTERSAFVRKHERGTYWHATHEVLFKDLPDKLKSWFAYGFSGHARGDFIRALNDQGKGAVWEHVLAGKRNLWSTASLVMAAGRVLAQTSEGWRFLPEAEATGLTVWPWRLDPITAEVSPADGKVNWHLDENSKSTYLFGRKPDIEYGAAMAEALNALLKIMPV